MRHVRRLLRTLTIEPPMPQEHGRPVARQHVRQRSRVDRRRRERPARGSVQPMQDHAAVQISRPAGDGVHFVIQHEHAAMQRPRGFQLLVGHEATILGRRPETPSQLAVGRSHAIDPAVRRAENRCPAMDGGRRVDATARGETPKHPPAVRIQGMDCVRVDRGDKHPPVGDHGTADRALAELRFPSRLDGGRDGRRTGAAARRVVAVRGPVGCGDRFRRLVIRRPVGVGRSLFQSSLRTCSVVRPPGCRPRRRQHVEAVQLGFDVTGAGMGRRIDQPVARHHAVLAGTSHPGISRSLRRWPCRSIRSRPGPAPGTARSPCCGNSVGAP
jgi:hypothetical protein